MDDLRVVSDFEDINIEKWISFVDSHPNGNIFQTPFFFQIYNQTRNYKPLVIAVLNNNNDILGIQVSVVLSVYNRVLAFVTSRSIIFGGPLIFNEDKKVLEVLLIEYLNRIKKNALYSQYRNMWNWGSLKDVFKKMKMKDEDHLDILLNLTKGEDQLWSEMKRVRRKGINQAYKKNVIVKEIDISSENQLAEAYSIIKSVYQRIKLPLHDIDFFRNAAKYLGNKVLSLGIFVENELVAVRIALCYNGIVYDWYAGAKEEYLSYRPNDVLPWELIKWGVSNKYKVFDFGGAGKPNIPYGVRDHKLKFGGEVLNYGRFEIIHKPLLMKIAKTGFKLKQKMIKN